MSVNSKTFGNLIDNMNEEAQMEYWKYKAIDKLKDYPAQKAAVVNLPEEIERLESEAYSIRSANSNTVPVQGGGSQQEDRMISNITHRGELESMLKRAEKAVSIVERGLSVLNDDEQYILDKMYIHRTKGYMEILMGKYGLSDPTGVYRRADKALLRFTVAVYGATES